MKPAHNIISADTTLKLKNTIWALPYLAVMGLIWGYLADASSGAIVGLVAGVAISVLIGPVTAIFDGPRGASAISTGSKSTSSNTGARNQPASGLNAVRYHKLCHQFDDALLEIEEVLDKDPDFAEALLLKAQILWEGFGDRNAASKCLQKILAVEPDEKAVFHRWALIFFNELSGE
ncbi:MAG: tetratricopeptide repeat protein [Desulfobacterales bacterium]|jgi:tetratricopeptide (TPR) repeat protein